MVFVWMSGFFGVLGRGVSWKKCYLLADTGFILTGKSDLKNIKKLYFSSCRL